MTTSGSSAAVEAAHAGMAANGRAANRSERRDREPEEVSGVSEAARQLEESRESHFWDVYPDWISLTPVDPKGMDVYGRTRVALLGELAEKTVLDLGCGIGYSSALFALLGARVKAVDISPRCAQATAAQAHVSGVGDKVAAQVASAYALPFPDATFDLAHGQDILHHLEMVPAGKELWRVLKPGGHAVFQENNASNPVLMLARRLCGHLGIPKWSTDDEHPLTRAEIHELGRVFGGAVEVHYPTFEFFLLFDMKILRAKLRPVTVVCWWLDRIIHHLVPPLRPYGWKQIVVIRKAAGT